MTEILDDIYGKCKDLAKWANEAEYESVKELDADCKSFMQGEAEGLRIANDILIDYLIDKEYVPND